MFKLCSIIIGLRKIFHTISLGVAVASFVVMSFADIGPEASIFFLVRIILRSPLYSSL